MCSKSVAKFFLIAFNILFFLFGAALLAAGIFVVADRTQILQLLSNIPNSGAALSTIDQTASLLQQLGYVIIGIGAAIFIIGFSGCCGAIRESKCLLYIYAALVGLIIIAQIVGGALAFVYRDTLESRLQSFLNQTIAERYVGIQFDLSTGTITESIEPFSAAWDLAMVTFQCCGNTNYTDFATYATQWTRTYNVSATYAGGSTTVSFTNAAVPVTCCSMTDRSLFPAQLANVRFTNITSCLLAADSASTNQAPCFTTLRDLFQQYVLIIGGVGIGIAIVEIIGFASAIYLACNAGKDDDY